MSIEAQLPDGTILEFPDGTADTVVQAKVKERLFGLDKATSIGPTPGYQRHFNMHDVIGVGPDIDLPSMEDVAETLPAAVAGGATMLATKNPVMAGVAGGAAGEAGRQLVRRAFGAPAATGVAQRTLGLDPDSPEAAAAGIGSEALAGVAGAGSAKLLKALSSGLDRSAKRSILNILQPRTAREKADAMRLASVAQRENLVPAMSGRASQLERAKAALAGAKADSDAITQRGVAAGQTVEARPVIDAAVDSIPANLPGVPGAINTVTPRSGHAVRRAASQVADDVFNTVANTGGGSTKVPLEAAISERRRLDELLTAMYDAGREQAPIGTRSVQTAADAWRGAIADSFPDLGAANLRQSDLIHITEMMRRAAAEAERTGGMGTSMQEAGAIGAGAVGRMSVPAMLGVRSLVTAAPFASLSAAGKRLAAKLAEGGAQTAQLWVRAADLSGLSKTVDDQIKERERHRKAAAALRTQAEGSPTP
jgi:hypothetical protein